jgi:glycosyltransferase involved in cell wall biosynthesis
VSFHSHIESSRSVSSRILYLTGDGLLEPLGASQVTSYVVRLARDGYPYNILSLEKSWDLADIARQQSLRSQLEEAGVEWKSIPYKSGSIAFLARTYISMFDEALKVCKVREIALIHARSFLMGVIARRIKKKSGTPYIFDARGYWVDERAESGRWFKRNLLYRSAKSLEYKVARDADAIITLTDLQRDDFRAIFPEKIIETITTCVDFDQFNSDVAPADVPTELLQRLDGKLVLALIGSLNASYKIREAIRVFAEVYLLQPDAHLLCLTRQTDEMRALLKEEGISDECSTVATVFHDEMHQWMPLAHWGMLLLATSPAKRASMPTKLGEMLAAGVRPIQYGCNDEVSQIVRNTGSGLLLSGLRDEDLREVARQIVAIGKSREGLRVARERALEKFSVVYGARRYADILKVLKSSVAMAHPQETT